MEFSNEERQNRHHGKKTWKQFAGIALAAVFGSSVTAGVLSYAWNPSKLQAVANASATSTSSSAAIDRTSTMPVAAGTSSGDPNSIIEQVFKSVEPDVVAVVNYQNVSDFFTQQSSLQEYGVGSGVLFKKDANFGYFVTNNHVVSGENKLEVVLDSGTHVTATLVGADPYTDLAVIKVPVAKLGNVTPAQFADSNNIQVGQTAIAIGTPLGLNFAETLTSGVISGKSRVMPVETPDGSSTLDYQSVIQTDAAINPGNSGGPLLNYLGQVVGINSSKIVETDTQSMGFAIPSDEVKDVVRQILTTGKVAHPALGISGYSLSDLPQQYWPNVPTNYGVYVYSVDTALAKAGGLKAGDVIVSVNGQTVQDEASLRTDLFALQPNTTVKIGVYRGSKKLTLSVRLGTMTASQATAVDSASGSSIQSVVPGGSGASGSYGNNNGVGGPSNYGSGGY